MKTQKNKLVLIAVLTVMSALTLTPSALGDGNSPGRGGSSKLIEFSGGKQAPATAAVSGKMGCAKCKDATVTVKDLDVRGSGAKAQVQGGLPTKTLSKHLCDDCRDELVVKGHGKSKVTVRVHKCASCI